MPIPWIDAQQHEFPPVDHALSDPNGLLAAGGELTVERLLDAYCQGIFPWYEFGQPVLWWSPDPRLVLYPDQLQVSRSMARVLRNHQYRLSMDEDFPAVLSKCAAIRRKGAGTWITNEMVLAYTRLHQLGFAHSVEVWSGPQLVGGLYGVALGKIFYGESMFSTVSNTSKLALIVLAKQLKNWKFKLIDCQVSSAHLHSLGAVEISRQDFQRYLRRYVTIADSAGKWKLEPELVVY